MPNKSSNKPSYRGLGFRVCAKCGKSKDDGVTLLQCSACGVDFYCGGECQRADWPSHKDKCRINRQARERLAASPERTQEVEALRRWTRVHRPTLFYLSLQELGVLQDPSVADRTLFMVKVRSRPQETNERRRFEITEASPFPIDEVGEAAPQIRQAIETVRAAHRQPNYGTYMLFVLPDDVLCPPNLIPLDFEMGGVLPMHHTPKDMIDIVNQGRLL
ncbi:hypothetical protein NM688_g5823 [Phlebia brevispora]|uniref:Uncharacterized protein n=1 Tax=Phlebia brevispora TaxID=194682 RepID=A0ACC1SPE1_9APHY|nr:hypothetical protein NM688_g5823 [Phlebia brevispora]